MVQETCFLAEKLLQWNKATNFGETEKLDLKRLKFHTNDPAPPYNVYDGPDVEKHNDIAFLE
jgi:hypothetical protein